MASVGQRPVAYPCRGRSSEPVAKVDREHVIHLDGLAIEACRLEAPLPEAVQGHISHRGPTAAEDARMARHAVLANDGLHHDLSGHAQLAKPFRKPGPDLPENLG